MTHDYTQTAEADLLAEFVQQRSEPAFTELVRRHLPMVLGVCRRVLDDEHAAQDATQAVFLALARKAGSLGQERALGGWLHHCALCAARNERTARARRLRREQEAAAMQQDAAAELTPETTAALREWLDRELDALPAKYRRPLVMVHLEGRSLEETAAALNCKDGTLRVWLNRAREKLRNRLAKRGVSVTVPALIAWLASHTDAAAAAVPPDLGAAAAKSAVLWITGGSAVAGLAPNVVAIAKGALHAMFISKLKTAAVVTATVAVVTTASALSWQKVYEARDKGLPKTAIEELKPIIADAMKNKKYAEAIKAICTKIAFEGNIEGNKPEEKVTRLQAELEKAPAEMKPMMQAILANWYWHYFQQNRWRFQQRTQTAEAPGKDFTTWDLPRILAEIDKHFTTALANEKLLKATPVAQYDDLLEKGNVPDAYRPTVFDFLAFEALQFYQAGEQGAAKAEDEFEIQATSPIFGTVAEFLAWQPATTDTGSAKLKAIRLFQNLLAFHQKDEDKTAFIDADLYRLQFGKNQSVGPEENDRYKAALKRFVDEWADSEIAARALFNWATVLVEENELAEAHKLAKRGADVFPKSYGGVQCFNLLQQLESKQVSISTERVWNEPWPVIAVNYKNVTKAFFRAVPQDFDAFVAKQRWGFGQGWEEAYIKELLAKQPVASWDAALPATTDYRERTEKLTVPKDLKPGFYIILASHDASFGKDNNQVSGTVVWVSDLALVVRSRQYEGALDGFVLKALTGEPVADAKIRSWSRDREGKLKPAGETKTDENGMFRFQGGDRSLLLLAEKDGQAVASDNEFYLYRSSKPTPAQHTVFFTDRSLYRPGQTIQYKGICYHVDTEGNNYRTLGGQTLTVLFRDPNGKEVAKAQHKANGYGAFSGSFTAPGGSVTGQMMLQVENGNGYAYINVEEYKRPKFQVELSKSKDAPKLGAEVVMPGKATAYTGAAIGGAKVKWRVVREVQFPHWCWWGRYFLPPNRGDSQNIAHGTTTTGADGSFTIKFTATPDLSVPEKTEPTFSFNVYADVTDSTGETRSDSQITRAGYTALSATVTTKEWQTTDKPMEWTVCTTSLDGEPQSAEGVLKVYVLKQPEKVIRAELQATGYDYWWFRRNMGKNAEPKADPARPDSWELAEVVAEKPFKTDATGKVTVETPLKAGIYRAMVETKDRFGKSVTARLTWQVMDLKGAKYPVKLANHFAVKDRAVEPGESFVAFWGTGYDTGRAYVELEHRGKILRAFWTGEGRTQEVFEQAVTEEMRGGFTMRLTYVRENRAYLENQVIDVPWSNKNLTIKWEHFTSKLEPGKKETWTAVITSGEGRARPPGAPSSKQGKADGAPGGRAQPVCPRGEGRARPRGAPSSKQGKADGAPGGRALPVEHAVAEMVATLYDASLDQYKLHHWMQGFNVFRREYSRVHAQFENGVAGFQHIIGGWPQESRSAELTYRHYPHDITQNLWFFGYFGGKGGGRGMLRRAAWANGVEGDNAAMMDGATAPALAAMADPGKPMGENKALRGEFGKSAEALGKSGGKEPAPGPDLGKVTARKNLNETAFFFPHILSDADGVVRMEFTMPEALTEWKFMGFVHDKDLRSGFLQDKTVTAKDLMVEPNPPRFVREGDVIEFTVKVSNQSAARQTGKVKLSLADARTLKSVDAELANKLATQEFDIPAKESKSFSWRLSVPDGMDFLTYKAVGATDRLSDGEEGYLPVLSRRILVIESLPLPIRGAQTKKFEFTKLLQSGKSRTLKSENLTVQMVSQPAWYAVMALPYLMEYPHECSEQIFNRLYANSLARFIANSDPKIRRVFDLWKNTPALDSPLEKNQDLKSVLIEETPWLRDAQDESQARRNVGILFDANRLDNETRNTFQKLAQMQLGDGLWPWFPGCPGDHYITLYITTGFGRMRHLGAEGLDMSLAIKSLNALDAWMDSNYHEILKHMKNPDEYVPSSIDAFYLYGRSFFLKDKAIAKEHQNAVDFYMKQARKYWLKLDCRQSQGHLAIALARFSSSPVGPGDPTPTAIMKSIKERSVSNEEMGLFWRDTELSWWWYRAPIETQALMIEALDEVMGDAQAVEDAKVWLLKQKQTQNWKTTKATADAVYGLLLRGKNLLASDALVEVSLAGQTIKPEKVEAGTGFYEKKFTRGEIKPDMGKITVKKTDEGVSWGSVHWQYLEDMTKVTPYEGTPLKLKKSLWKKETEKTGQVLKPVKGALAVGDELVVRVELRVDRDMEYVHLKDQRGSGTEPVNVLSRTKYQDGLAYYESTRDTASHFFIHYLPKGVYVFEYSVRVQLKGKYQSGIASIQCMYAPEFNSHSESFDLEVK